MTAAAVKLLQKQQTSRLYPRIIRIVAASVRGSLKLDIVPEWERIVVEAIELAKMEAKGVQMPAEWTRETIGEGLGITSFPQYRVPVDSSVS